VPLGALIMQSLPIISNEYRRLKVVSCRDKDGNCITNALKSSKLQRQLCFTLAAAAVHRQKLSKIHLPNFGVSRHPQLLRAPVTDGRRIVH